MTLAWGWSVQLSLRRPAKKLMPRGADGIAPAHQILPRLRTERIHFRSGRQGPGAREIGNQHRQIAARQINLLKLTLAQDDALSRRCLEWVRSGRPREARRKQRRRAQH